MRLRIQFRDLVCDLGCCVLHRLAADIRHGGDLVGEHLDNDGGFEDLGAGEGGGAVVSEAERIFTYSRGWAKLG